MSAPSQPGRWRQFVPISIWLVGYEKSHLAADIVAALIEDEVTLKFFYRSSSQIHPEIL